MRPGKGPNVRVVSTVTGSVVCAVVAVGALAVGAPSSALGTPAPLAGRATSSAVASVGIAKALNASVVDTRSLVVRPRSRTEPEHPAKIEPCKSKISSYKVPHLFIVWACGGDGTLTSDLSAAANIIGANWREMANFMGGGPLPDNGGVAGGGDRRIDFYLLSPGQKVVREGAMARLHAGEDGATVPENDHGTTSSGYILLSRERLEKDPADFNSDEVHEFFHLLARRYHGSDCTGGQFWFYEASAVWAETHFARPTAPKQAEFRFGLFNPGQSLNRPVTNYDAFVWPYFMEQHAGADKIAEAWKDTKGTASCSALDAVVNSQAPFTKYFGEFAVENFDAKLPNIEDSSLRQWPVNFGDRYQDSPMDERFPERPLNQLPAPSIPPINTTTTATIQIAHLAAEYKAWGTGITNSGESFEFNFSKITDRKNVDITAIVAEDNNVGTSGSSKPYLTIPVGGNYLRICAPADNSQDGTVQLQGIRVYLIFANHSMAPGGDAGGSYTVTPRTVCAASASGNYSETTTIDLGGGQVTNETFTLANAHFIPSAEGWQLDQTRGTYTYSNTDFGSGSGPDVDIIGNPPFLNAWWVGPFAASSAAPFLAVNGAILSDPPGAIVEGGICPLPGPDVGAYINNFQAVDLTCSSSGSLGGNNARVSVSGTIQGNDVILCGIWEGPSCSVTSPPADTQRPIHQRTNSLDTRSRAVRRSRP